MPLILTGLLRVKKTKAILLRRTDYKKEDFPRREKVIDAEFTFLTFVVDRNSRRWKSIPNSRWVFVEINRMHITVVLSNYNSEMSGPRIQLINTLKSKNLTRENIKKKF